MTAKKLHESPESYPAGNLPTSVERAKETRAAAETAAAIVASMFLAGGWAGARYQASWFVVALGVATIGCTLVTVLYAVFSRRYRVLRYLPLLVVASLAKELLASLFSMSGVIGVLVGGLFSLVRPTRQNWLLVNKFALVAVTGVLSIFLYSQLQKTGARRAAEQGETIIEAIRRYEAKTGALPASLDVLVPSEIESIPETGMAGFPSFQYRSASTEEEESEYFFRTYELRVNLYKLLQFDCLVYWPEGGYPDFLYGGGVERIGDWAYVHE